LRERGGGEEGKGRGGERKHPRPTQRHIGYTGRTALGGDSFFVFLFIKRERDKVREGGGEREREQTIA